MRPAEVCTALGYTTFCPLVATRRLASPDTPSISIRRCRGTPRRLAKTLFRWTATAGAISTALEMHPLPPRTATSAAALRLRPLRGGGRARHRRQHDPLG